MSEIPSHAVTGPTEGTPAPANPGPSGGEATITVTTPESQVHVLFPQPVRIIGSQGRPVDLYVAVFGVRAGKPTTITGTVVQPDDPTQARRPQRLDFSVLPLPVREQIAARYSQALAEIADKGVAVV